NVTERVISQILSEMDGIEELRGVVVLAATNRPDMLDAALLRAGRFEVRLELPLPDHASRVAILKIHAGQTPLADDVDLDELAKLTEGMSGSDIESICRRAAMESIREFVEAYPEAEDVSGLQIRMQALEAAVETVRRLRDGTEAPSRA